MTRVFFYIVLCAASLQVTVCSNRVRRFIGGQNAKPAQFPHIVSIQKYSVIYDEVRHYCAGSIISKNMILTAAHCVYDVPVKNISVVMGSHLLNKKKKKYLISKIIYHKYFRTSVLKHDIAILKLKENVKFSKRVKKIPLETEEMPQSATLTVSGWGYKQNVFNETASNILQYSNVHSISLKQCRKKQFYLILIGVVKLNEINKKIICTYDVNRGFCNGDSGGPLIYKGKQVGIVSWSMGCSTFPDIYTKVSAYSSWINKTINILK